MVFGVNIQKRNVRGQKWVNRYYVNTGSIKLALDAGDAISQLESNVHGATVEIYNIHVWVPGVNPNVKDNLPVSHFGLIPTGAPLKNEIVSRVFFSTGDGSNPHYKDFRCNLDRAAIIGTQWEADYKNDLAAFVAAMQTLDWQVCTRSGSPLTANSYSVEYHFRQLSKAWYDRAPLI